MLHLYEISERYINAINNLQIDEETGEILSFDEIEQIESDFNEKAENIALFIKSLVAESEAIKNEEKKLSERRKSSENKAEKLKEYLKYNMQTLGKNKIKTPKAELGFRKSIAVEVDDNFINWAKNNANDLLTYKDPAPNKTEIKNAINNGAIIEFAKLVENQNLTIK